MNRHFCSRQIPDQVNCNNRIYPRHVLESAIKKAQEKINAGNMLVFDHTKPDCDPYSMLLSNAVGVVESIDLDDKGMTVNWTAINQFDPPSCEVTTVGYATVDINAGIATIGDDYDLKAFTLIPQEQK